MHNTTKTLLASILLAACGDDNALPPDAPAPPADVAVQQNPCGDLVPSALAADPLWFGTNHDDLTAWLDAGGCQSPGYKPNKRPVATFDWDNTISKNDFGDAITFYLIKNGKVVQPPNQDWKQTSAFMTDAAATALTAACGVTALPGESLHTDTNTECADEILSMYIDGVTRGGLPAFAGWNYRRIEPTYAWTAQLMAGYTHAEIQSMMLDTVTAQLAAVHGATQTVGTRTGLNAWLRIYDQTKDVIHAAQTRGYDVWIITASPQDAIEAVSEMAGVPKDHVIGIRTITDANGKLTYGFAGCGDLADGQQQMIPYIQGKRCYINKFVFGDTTDKALRRRPDGKRQYFAAGDSDTDVEFLRDATYKLVINRNKKELMCNAYYNEDDSWRINPMFIDPKGMASPYQCPTTACKDANGASTPCLDLGGNVIPVQVDTVHP
jgi:phosphoserine phosphatase